MVDKNTHMSVWSIGRAEKNIVETNILMYNGSSRETTVPCIRVFRVIRSGQAKTYPLLRRERRPIISRAIQNNRPAARMDTG